MAHKNHFMPIVFLSLIFGACTYTSKTTRMMYNQVENETYDMLVVPGVPLDDTAWSRTMRGRIYWAKFLYDKGIAKNLMFSGGAVYTPYYEGKVMAMYAEALGIPPKNIFSETKAEHSTENIYYSYKKARKMGFKKIALASDPFQTKQLRRFAQKRISQDFVVIPMMVDTLRAMEPTMIHPTIDFESARAKDFVPITQREGFWKRLWGTLGKNIDEMAYE